MEIERSALLRQRPSHPPLAMRPLLIAGLFAATATTVGAQASQSGIKLSDIAGVWNYRALIGPTDTVVVASVLTTTADGKGWTIQHDSDPAIPVRLLTVAGDSIVLEAGPYGSTLRPGQTVTRLQVVLHYHDNRMSGRFDAHYASGDVVHGRADAARAGTGVRPDRLQT
jgi:hypothetical protein